MFCVFQIEKTFFFDLFFNIIIPCLPCVPWLEIQYLRKLIFNFQLSIFNSHFPIHPSFDSAVVFDEDFDGIDEVLAFVFGLDGFGSELCLC